MKKITSLFLTIILLIGCVSTTALAATYNVEATMQYAENHWSDGKGLCAEFVSKCVKAGGIDISIQAGTGGCWREICKKTGLDMCDLTLSPEGNALYKDNNSILQKGDVVVQWCYTHNIAPHIMICGGYNSNGYATFYAHNKAMNNTTYDLKTNTAYEHTKQCDMGAKVIHISSLGNNCSHYYPNPNTELCSKCGAKYQGIEKSESKRYTVNVKSINLRTVPYSKAGSSNGVSYAGETVTSSLIVINMYGNEWVKITNSKGQSGYTYIGNLKEYNEPEASSLQINLTKYPTSLKKGSNFGLRGTVSSNYAVKQIKGYILNGNTTVQSTIDMLDKKSVDVSGIKLNNSLIFNNLGTGNYTLVVEATDSSGKTITVKKYFEIYAEQTRATSSLAINLVKYPVTLKQGTNFGLRGSVDSNYTIVKVRGYVKNSSGSMVLSSTDTPNSTSMNIQYADLNNSLVFNKLSPGNYTMVVEATDSSGRVVTATKSFSVQGATVQPATNVSDNGAEVTGTVNIPSSWTDLSIRIGPSTNYQVVGGMPQGAKCTVYPNKTSNGWYYVNYNGIWGYASGKQINLNSSSASNTRTGIVNIPSSWTDLSIRTGPSTGYQIVGGMPNGARCTVYPDKASNGWYYVEYNGVAGYAAGNRINLQ